MFLNLKDMSARIKCAGTAIFVAVPVFLFMVGCSLCAIAAIVVAVAFTAYNLGDFVSLAQLRLGLAVVCLLLLLMQLCTACISFASYAWSGKLKRSWQRRRESFLKVKQLFAHLFREVSRPEMRTFRLLAAINVFSILACTVAVFNLSQGDQITFGSSLMATLCLSALLLVGMFVGWSIVKTVVELPEESVEGLPAVLHIPLWSLILMDYLDFQSPYAGFIPVAGILLAAAVLGFCYKCGKKPESAPKYLGV